jgi:hypothetical protein
MFGVAVASDAEPPKEVSTFLRGDSWMSGVAERPENSGFAAQGMEIHDHSTIHG